MPSLGLTISYLVFFLIGLFVMLFGIQLSKYGKKKIYVSSVSTVKKEKKKTSKFDTFLDKNWIITNSEKNMQRKIITSGLPITVRQLTKIRLLFILAGFLFSLLMNNILVAIPMCIMFYIIPGYIVNRKAKKREMIFEGQLLDNFQIFVTDFISTRNVQNSIYNMTKKSIEPLKSEWELLSRNVNSGIPFDKCFVAFADRTGSKWSRIFAQIMISYYNQGNDFTEQLMSLTAKMTDEKIRKQENQTEISSMVTLNIVMNIAVPIVYILNQIMQPEASAAFSTTVQGRLIILAITICCGLSLWLGHKIAEW